MSAPRPTILMPAYGWCAVLAAASDDVLGAVLAEVCARHRPRAPELLEVTHYRHHTVEATGTAWYLFIAAVMGDSEGELADTHPALARDLWRAADLWTHSFPKFRKFPPGHAALARYHRTPAGLVLPAPPPPRTSAALAPPKRVERAEPEVARAAAPVPEQKGLFG